MTDPKEAERPTIRFKPIRDRKNGSRSPERSCKTDVVQIGSQGARSVPKRMAGRLKKAHFARSADYLLLIRHASSVEDTGPSAKVLRTLTRTSHARKAFIDEVLDAQPCPAGFRQRQ